LSKNTRVLSLEEGVRDYDRLVEPLWFECWYRKWQLVGSIFGLCQNKENKFDICCFMAEHGALTSKSKHCLARRQDNVSVRMEQHVYPYTHYKIPDKRVGLV